MRRLTTVTALLLATVISLGFAGCGSDDVLDISGNWSGTWSNTSPAYSGTFNATLLQDGPSFTGTGTMSGIPGLGPQQGDVTGSIVGDSVTAKVGSGTFEINAQLTVSGDGNTLSGTYAMSPGNLSGTMTVSR